MNANYFQRRNLGVERKKIELKIDERATIIIVLSNIVIIPFKERLFFFIKTDFRAQSNSFNRTMHGSV